MSHRLGRISASCRLRKLDHRSTARRSPHSPLYMMIPERMRSAVLKTVGVGDTLTLPLGVGMAFVAEPVALLLLGEK